MIALAALRWLPVRWLAWGGAALALVLAGWLVLSQARSGAVQEVRREGAENALKRAVVRSEKKVRVDVRQDEERRSAAARVREATDSVRVSDPDSPAPDGLSINDAIAVGNTAIRNTR
jgi:hypothetical protein